MTHSEVLSLSNKLSKVKGLSGATVNYAILRNLKNLESEIDVYQKQEKEIGDMAKEYTEAVEKITRERATVSGEVKTKTNLSGQTVYDISANQQTALSEEIKELNTKYKDVIDATDLKWAELIKFRLESQSDFKLIKIKKEDVPSDISTENMTLIFDLIEAE
jgi:hypothetical protein